MGQQTESGFNFWWDLKFYLLFDSGLDSGGLGLNFKNEFGESVILLSKEGESAFDFGTDSVLSDNFVGGGLLGGDFVDSDFTLFNIVFSLNQMAMNLSDDMIESVDFLQQDDALQLELSEFPFDFLRYNKFGSSFSSGLSILRFLNSDFQLLDKVFSVNQVATDLL